MGKAKHDTGAIDKKEVHGERVYLGDVMVDSGQVMIVDPCYLDEFKNDDFRHRAGIRNKKDGREYAFPDDGTWETKHAAEGGKSMNQLIAEDRLKKEEDKEWEEFKEYPGITTGSFSYSGVCALTCGDELAGGQVDHGAVASRTNHGDGYYPVYGTYDDEGRPTSLTIEFVV